MKTRVIHTSLWRDSWVSSLSKEERLVYVYLLTNEQINSVFLYEVLSRDIAHFTGVDEKEVDEILDTLVGLGKIMHYKNHILLLNAGKYERYKGWKNAVSKVRTIELLSNDIYCYFSDHIREIIADIKSEVNRANKKYYAGALKDADAILKRLSACSGINVPKKPSIVAKVLKKRPSVAVATVKSKDWQKMTPADQVKALFSNEICTFKDGEHPAQDQTIRWIESTWKVSTEDATRELGRFMLYWTEPTKSGKKQLWETKPTFEVKRRIVTWLTNAGRYGKREKGASEKYVAVSV